MKHRYTAAIITMLFVVPMCKVMGNAEGSSGGLLLWAIIPLGVNGRFKNAYEDALHSAGGTHLIDVKVIDHWYYIPFFGIALSARVEGKAIQCPGYQLFEKKQEKTYTTPPPQSGGDTGWGGK